MLNSKARQFLFDSRVTERKSTQLKKIIQRRNTIAEVNDGNNENQIVAARKSKSNTNQLSGVPSKINRRRGTVASESSVWNVNHCFPNEQPDVAAQKSVKFNPNVKVFDLMNISKKNIPFSRGRRRSTSINGEGCSSWSHQPILGNHNSQEYGSENDSSMPVNSHVAAHDVESHILSVDDNSTELTTVTVVTPIDQNSSTVSKTIDGIEQDENLPNISDTSNGIEIAQSYDYEPVQVTDLINFDSIDEHENSDRSEVASLGKETASSPGSQTQTFKLIDVESPGKYVDTALEANPLVQYKSTFGNWIDDLFGFNDQDETSKGGLNIITPAVLPVVQNIVEPVRRRIPELIPLKKRRLSKVAELIASKCEEYDSHYLLPDNDGDRELMKINFAADASFGELD